MMKRYTSEWLIYLAVGLLTLAMLGGMVHTRILAANNGFFSYSLDDPYIHLALAENIAEGHYGVNVTEHSAPSSSIIWPFLLAPFAQNPMSALWLNLLFAVATLVAIAHLVATFTRNVVGGFRKVIGILLTGLLVIIANLIPLAYTGMEHTMQVFLSTMIALALIRSATTSVVPWWLWLCLLLAPLVRYECMAIVAPTLVYLFLSGRKVQTTVLALIIGGCIVGFSAFLHSMVGSFVPASVVVKSEAANPSHSPLWLAMHYLYDTTYKRNGLVIWGIVLTLGWMLISQTVPKPVRAVAYVAIGSVVLFFAAGHFSMFARYEAFVLFFVLIAALFVLFEVATATFNEESRSRTLKTGFLVVVLGVIAVPFIGDVRHTVPAANDIYIQQYQMHRFVTDYWKQPVAVNDLGWVTYKNDLYVLDLWGLGSHEALKRRSTATNTLWTSELASKKNVQLAMVYDEWFERGLKLPWKKVATLRMNKEATSCAYNLVGIYATLDNVVDATEKLRQFESSLPPGAYLEFEGMATF